MMSRSNIVHGIRMLFFLDLFVTGLLFISPFSAIFKPTCVCEYTMEASLCNTVLAITDFFFSGLLVASGLFGLLWGIFPKESYKPKIFAWGWGSIVILGLGLGLSLGYFMHRLDRFM